MAAKFELRSIEDTSVIRKFSVLFSFTSLFPFMILSAIFFIFYKTGNLKLDANFFLWTVLLTGIFVLLGFLGMRTSLTRLNKVSSVAKNIVHSGIPQFIDLAREKGDNEIVQIARSFNEVVRKLESTIKELEKSKGVLYEVLGIVASGVSSSENIDSFVDIILKTTGSALNAETGLLLLIDKTTGELTVKSMYGVNETLFKKNSPLPKNIETVDWVIKQHKPLLVPRLSKTPPSQTEEIDLIFQPPFICVPLLFQNTVIGAILISSPGRDINFTEEELLILSNISSQIALAIENARLNEDAQKTYLETISALAMAVEARDTYSRGHSDRVGEYAVKIAEKLGLGAKKIEIIKAAALLHDVGKIGINDDILRKPSSLNEYEWAIMRQHPAIGEGIIVPLHGFVDLKGPIRHHHEWFDGSGYPDHLKGEQIPLESRILTVADSFDAMTSDRPYRKKMSLEEAKQELLKYSGIRYDPPVVQALIQILTI